MVFERRSRRAGGYGMTPRSRPAMSAARPSCATIESRRSREAWKPCQPGFVNLIDKTCAGGHKRSPTPRPTPRGPASLARRGPARIRARLPAAVGATPLLCPTAQPWPLMSDQVTAGEDRLTHLVGRREGVVVELRVAVHDGGPPRSTHPFDRLLLLVEPRASRGHAGAARRCARCRARARAARLPPRDREEHAASSANPHCAAHAVTLPGFSHGGKVTHQLMPYDEAEGRGPSTPGPAVPSPALLAIGHLEIVSFSVLATSCAIPPPFKPPAAGRRPSAAWRVGA